MQVNVVTAVHGSYATFLARTWASLRRQSHDDWVWLLQVDGPAEDAAVVLRALDACGAAGDKRVEVAAHGTREGPAVTRNIALARGIAPLVQNVDADDELEPDALTVLADALAARPGAGFAVGHARDLLSDGLLREQRLPVADGVLGRGVLLDRWVTDGAGYRLPVHPAGAMWRRSLLVRLGGWSALRGMEDTGLLMAGSASAEGVLVREPTLRYRRHPAQCSTEPSKFNGRDCQVALVRQRAAFLRSLPAWSEQAAA